MQGKKRLLTKTRTSARKLNVKTLTLPLWAKCSAEIRRQGGWDAKVTLSTQANEKFAFDGKAFLRYTKEVFGRKIDKIYFPAAYLGKVAKELSIAGFDVYASDISPQWVNHLRLNGLYAQIQSIDDIPDTQFDAVVCFEPYCADSSLPSYKAMLRMLSRGIPYIEITFDLSPTEVNAALFDEMRDKEMREQVVIPPPDNSMIRIGYDYGAIYRYHTILTAGLRFSIHSIFPKAEARNRAAEDLMIMESSQELQDIISISALSKMLNCSKERIAAAIQRLKHVLDERFGLCCMYESTDMYEARQFKRCLTLNDIPEEEIRNFLRKINIRNC
jgi:hypothetical protein